MSTKSRTRKRKNKIIAVDARPLSFSIAGISRAISKIVENIQEDYDFYLFSHLPCHKDYHYLLEQENVVWNQSQTRFGKKGGLWFTFELPKILNKMKPDIFWGPQQTIPFSLNKNIKTIITINDYIAYFYPKTMRKIALIQQRIYQRYSLFNADMIVSISKNNIEDTKKIFPEFKKEIKIIYYGIDKKRKFDKNSIPILDKNFILAVSTIEPRKNYSTLIEAYYKYFLSETKEPYYLVIVGKRGWESKKFYNRLDEIIGKTGTVFLLENVTDDLLSQLYQRCAFFCLPSMYEGFGIPVLEAISFGKNLILSDIPVFREIADEYARFVPTFDIDAWKISLQEYVDLHRKRLLKKIKFEIENWTWEKASYLYKEAFNSLTSS